MFNTVKSSLLFLVLLWGLPIAGIAQQNAIPAAPHILVYGAAEAKAIPDRFRLTVRIETLDINADQARKSAAVLFDSTINALKALDVSDGDIIATGLSIEPSERYDEQQRRYVFQGTEVVREIEVVFSETVSMEKFLAQTDVNENLQVSGVETFLSTEKQLELALRSKSIESSKQKAEVIAEEYGLEIKGIYSVSDVAPQYTYGITEGDWPVIWFWNDFGDVAELQRVAVTGSRLSESFSTGFVTFQDKIYAVFLVESKDES